MSSKVKFVCPVCETEFDRAEKWGQQGDRCPRCKAPLSSERQKEGDNIIYLLDKSQVDEDGFVQVTVEGSNPVIMRRVVGHGVIDFMVIYSGILGTGRMACPACGGYLGELTVFPGTTPKTVIDAPQCQKALRKGIDGRDGKCKKRTKFIYIHNPGGQMSIMPGVY
jgi:uncharacterized protein YbaR (Trm112 family)